MDLGIIFWTSSKKFGKKILFSRNQIVVSIAQSNFINFANKNYMVLNKKNLVRDKHSIPKIVNEKDPPLEEVISTEKWWIFKKFLKPKGCLLLVLMLSLLAIIIILITRLLR